MSDTRFFMSNRREGAGSSRMTLGTLLRLRLSVVVVSVDLVIDPILLPVDLLLFLRHQLPPLAVLIAMRP